MNIWTDRAVRRENGEEKPLGPRAARTRNTILAAAADVFARQGYQRTTMADIAGLGSVYQYFRDRADVVSALVRQSVTALRRSRGVTWSADRGASEIEPILAAYIRQYARFRGMAKVWEEVAFIDDELLALRRELGREFTAPVAAALRAAIEAGTVSRDIDVEIAAPALTGMVDRWCFVTYVLDPPPVEPDADHAARQLAMLWARSLRPTSGEEGAPGPRSRPSRASTRSGRRPR
jgi:AcrR family transcriptional regulator